MTPTCFGTISRFSYSFLLRETGRGREVFRRLSGVLVCQVLLSGICEK